MSIASTSGVDLPVVDKTGLSGVYDLTIAYMTEEGIGE